MRSKKKQQPAPFPATVDKQVEWLLTYVRWPRCKPLVTELKRLGKTADRRPAAGRRLPAVKGPFPKSPGAQARWYIRHFGAANAQILVAKLSAWIEELEPIAAGVAELQALDDTFGTSFMK